MKSAIVTLALVICLFLSATISAQEKDKGTLIADETTLFELKSSIKIKTYSDAIFKRILTDFPDKVKSYVVAFKKDRNGRYSEYTFYFDITEKAAVVTKISNY